MQLLLKATDLKLMYATILAADPLPALLNVALDARSLLFSKLSVLPFAKLPFLVAGQRARKNRKRVGVRMFSIFIALETFGLSCLLPSTRGVLFVLDLTLSSIVLFAAVIWLRSQSTEASAQ